MNREKIEADVTSEEITSDSHTEEVFEPTVNRVSTAASYFSRHPYASMIFVGLMFSLPLIIYGYPFSADDTVYHTLYYKNFSFQLWSGELYPRWLYLLNGSYGGPIFFYYPPMAYYLTSIFHPLQLSILHQLGLGAALGLVLSGLTLYLWLKEITSAGSALLSAIIYLLLPYSVYDIYGRGALAESFTFVWMPLILYFVVRVSRGSRLAIVGLAVSYALLCTTHLLTTMMFSAIPLVYGLILSDRNSRLKTLATTVAAMALGTGLSAAYILPAMTYQRYVYIEELSTGSFSFARALLTRQLVINGSMRYFWFVVVLGSVSLVCFFAGRLAPSAVKRRELSFWVAIAFCSVFMMIYISYPVWSVVRPLQMLQFPWRFNTILCVAALPLLAAGISSLTRPYTWLMKLTVVVISVFGIYSANDFRKNVSDAILPPSLERSELSARIDRLNLDWHAFWPYSTEYLAFDDIEGTLSNAPHSGDELTKAYLPGGGGTVSVMKWRPRDIELQIEAPDGGGVNVSQFYFPGWRARLADTLEDLPVTPSPDAAAMVHFTMPPGNHTVHVTLEKLWPEYVGQLLSGASALIALMLFLTFLFVPRFRNAAAPRTMPAEDEGVIY